MDSNNFDCLLVYTCILSITMSQMTNNSSSLVLSSFVSSPSVSYRLVCASVCLFCLVSFFSSRPAGLRLHHSLLCHPQLVSAVLGDVSNPGQGLITALLDDLQVSDL